MLNLTKIALLSLNPIKTTELRIIIVNINEMGLHIFNEFQLNKKFLRVRIFRFAFNIELLKKT